jgi:hypothetical protein
VIAPNLVDVRVELPDPHGGPAILSQGADRR